MKKKFLSICLAVAMCIGVCACGSDPADEEAVKEYAAAVASGDTSREAGTGSAAPEPTETPKAAATPKAMAAAAGTPKPTVTTAPKASATPAATEVPEATEVTATPKTATASAATAVPEAATTAKPTAAPAATPITSTSAAEKASASESAVTPNQPETPAEPAHTHTFVDRTVSEATCTEAKVVESVCSVCGASNGTRTEGSALGHDLYEDWFNEPNCVNGGWVTDRCRRCDYASGHEGTPLGHDWEETSTTGYNCTTSGVIRQTCKTCGAPGDSWENGQYGPHEWVSYSYDDYVIDESAPEGEKIKLEHFEGIRCAECGQEQ